jgi:hypothetical protein
MNVGYPIAAMSTRYIRLFVVSPSAIVSAAMKMRLTCLEPLCDK